LFYKIESQFRENAKSTTISADRKYKNDIMISYCYNDKQIVYKIEQFLINEGFDVWLDRDILHRQSNFVIRSIVIYIKI
jgi:hypothetical protein